MLATTDIPEAKKREDYLHWLKEGLQRGYKTGWAAYKFKDEYGIWPSKDWQFESDGAKQLGSEARQATCPACGK